MEKIIGLMLSLIHIYGAERIVRRSGIFGAGDGVEQMCIRDSPWTISPTRSGAVTVCTTAPSFSCTSRTRAPPKAPRSAGWPPPSG